MKKILLLGNTGKMGSAITRTFRDRYTIVGTNTSNLDATNFSEIKSIVNLEKPDILINCIAMIGTNQCEENIPMAITLNIMLPRLLAELSNSHNFLLINFSTSGVFDGKEKIFKVETDIPCPVNMYGITKYAGDCAIINSTEKYYIFRIPLLFGTGCKHPQWLDKMIDSCISGKSMKLADDITFCPTYNLDVAERMKQIIEEKYPYGLYHVSNSGTGSLFDIVDEVMRIGFACNSKNISRCSYLEFPPTYKKDVHSVIKSIKLPEMRDWRLAIKEYCHELKSI